MIQAGEIGVVLQLSDQDARASLKRFIQDALAAAAQIRVAFQNVLGVVGGGNIGGGAGGSINPGAAVSGGGVANAAGITGNLTANLTQQLQQAVGAITAAFSNAVASNVSSVTNTTINNISRTGNPGQGRGWFGVRPMAAAYLAYRGLEAAGRAYEQNYQLEESLQFDKPIEALSLAKRQVTGNMGGIGEFGRWAIARQLQAYGLTEADTRFAATDQEKLDAMRRAEAQHTLAESGGRFAVETRTLAKQRPLIGADPYTRSVGENQIQFEERQREAGLARAEAGRMEGMFGMDIGGNILRRAANQYEKIAAETRDAQNALAKRIEGQRLTLMGGRSESMSYLLHRQPLEAQIAQLNAEEEAAQAAWPVGSRERIRLHNLYDQERALRRQERGDTSRLINLNLGGRAAQLEALMGRSPIGAEAIGLATRGAEQVTELGQHGFRDEARQAAKNATEELKYFRRNYLESARATQADFTLMDYSNRRDTENPSDVLTRIENLLNNLPNILRDAIDH